MWLVVPIMSVEDLLLRSLASDDRVKREDAGHPRQESVAHGFGPGADFGPLAGIPD